MGSTLGRWGHPHGLTLNNFAPFDPQTSTLPLWKDLNSVVTHSLLKGLLALQIYLSFSSQIESIYIVLIFFLLSVYLFLGPSYIIVLHLSHEDVQRQ